ncbi:hypothetical protein AB1285_25080, partial [Microbacterium sp. NRRL B-14842]|uniref:hypothetical protein n=1 Tax=Microbacterium sp. NRRL B-14842 TaxID=3162881 RepID=UPI003D26C546
MGGEVHLECDRHHGPRHRDRARTRHDHQLCAESATPKGSQEKYGGEGDDDRHQQARDDDLQDDRTGGHRHQPSPLAT